MRIWPWFNIKDPRIRECRTEEEYFLRLEESKKSSNSVYALCASSIDTTECYRRYVGVWGIKDNKLYLVDIIGKYELISSQPIIADWLTGKLEDHRGEVLCHWGVLFEEDIHIAVEKGAIKGTIIMKNSKEQCNADCRWQICRREIDDNYEPGKLLELMID